MRWAANAKLDPESCTDLVAAAAEEGQDLRGPAEE